MDEPVVCPKQTAHLVPPMSMPASVVMAVRDKSERKENQRMGWRWPGKSTYGSLKYSAAAGLLTTMMPITIVQLLSWSTPVAGFPLRELSFCTARATLLARARPALKVRKCPLNEVAAAQSRFTLWNTAFAPTFSGSGLFWRRFL